MSDSHGSYHHEYAESSMITSQPTFGLSIDANDMQHTTIPVGQKPTRWQLLLLLRFSIISGWKVPRFDLSLLTLKGRQLAVEVLVA